MKHTFDKIDFNLLKCLYLLIEERSVTRAAERLFITQSAMSKTLARLRELFEDPLLVRHGSGLVPTPLADDLFPPLREIVTKVESCFDLKTFDPASATGLLHVAAPEQLALGIAPDLMVRLQQKAPMLALDSHHLSENFPHMLASGQTDFVIGRAPFDDRDFTNRLIHSARPMCWYRKGHPLSKKAKIDLADICSFPLVQIKNHFPEEDIAEARREILAASLKPRVVLSTSHMIVAITALLKSDAITLAPDFLSWLPMAGTLIDARPIIHIPAFRPFRADLHLIQHRRSLNSPLHQWVADEIENGGAIFDHGSGGIVLLRAA